MTYYKIAVNTPFNNSILTYKSEHNLERGTLVEVPLGKRSEKGCVLSVDESPDTSYDLKEVKGLLEYGYDLDGSYLGFLEWVARYYHYPLGQHIFDVLAKPLKRPRSVELIKGENRELPFELTSDQQNAYLKIAKSFNTFEKFLVHGVTGSGKTSIYLKLFQDVLRSGGSGCFLVPEINLTPQFINTFKTHLDGIILTYHSSMSKSEKNKVWEIVQKGEVPYLLIGVRSSIFLPFKELGVIVIDEEHDGSYKQDDRCPYHMRDVAIKLASQKKCPVVMGSATPTIETYHSLVNSKNYIRLANRVKDLDLPDIEVVDSRTSKGSRFDENSIWPFTQKSIEQIGDKLKNNEQVLVFVNRLGFANYVQCGSCGKEFHCLNCTSNLKFFKRSNVLKCQVCDFTMPYPEACPDCGNMKLLQKGFGTERLKEVLEDQFPTTKIERFDRDAVKTFKELEEILDRFEKRESQLLVGTQMLSKGHNFTGVNLVVLLGVDGQLNFPDFRSNEKVFQLVTQTAGRPGRSEMKGKVLIESLSPDNQIFKYIKDYNQEAFIKEELEVRETLGFPPFSRLVAIYFTSRFQNDAMNEATKAGRALNAMVSTHFGSVEILGPRPGIMEKRANKFTWTILLKSTNLNELHNLLGSFRRNTKVKSGTSIKVDVDPQNLA